MPSATVTMPDGTRVRSQQVQIVNGTVTVSDRRTGTPTVTSAVVDLVVHSRRRWTVTTESGVLEVRAGCGCGR
jgi:hypothetical protein